MLIAPHFIGVPMTKFNRWAFAFLCALPAALFAQAPAPESRQFDFLLGQWEIDVQPKVSSIVAALHGTPKLVGTWKAWRALDGLAVEDEMRVVDASGNPISLSHALRTYSKSEGRWKIQGLDAYRSHFSESTGQFQGGEMRLNGRSFDAEGHPVLTRIRYYDIAANGFRMTQDRSSDEGRTWDEGVIAIAAKRTAAAK
jgi:hypothetical protein